MSSTVVDPKQCVATSGRCRNFTERSEQWRTLCVAYIFLEILVQKATIILLPTELFISKHSIFFKLYGPWRCACVRRKGIWGHRIIAPLILNVGTSWRWVVSFTPRPFYLRWRKGDTH